MLWVIWDILIPLAAAFAVGLFFGWLLWRWRRMRLSSDELAAIRRSSSRYKSDAATLRNRNAELAEKLRAASGTNDQVALQELDAANDQIDKLRQQLKHVNQELVKYQRGNESGKVDDPGNQLKAARQRIHSLENQLNSREPKIVRRGVSIKNNSHQLPQLIENEASKTVDYDHLEEIAVRDEMIATLKHSLVQYGSEEDSTALKAKLELREQRILALESILYDSPRERSRQLPGSTANPARVE